MLLQEPEGTEPGHTDCGTPAPAPTWVRHPCGREWEPELLGRPLETEPWVLAVAADIAQPELTVVEQEQPYLEQQ